MSVPWEPIGAILEPYGGHVGVHFGLPVANLTFLKAFGAPLGLSFGLRAQFWIDFRSNLAPPSLQTSSMGTAECAERSAAPPQVGSRVLDSKSKSWPNIFKPQLLSFKSLGLDLRITPSLSLPRATHIPPGRPKIDDGPPADALFFDFLPFQNVFQNLLRKNIEKNAKIEVFGLPKPSPKPFQIDVPKDT